MSAETPSLRLAHKRPWLDEATCGPSDLYRLIVDAALEEFIPELDNLDDQTAELVDQVVMLAVSVTCSAAGVAPTWDELYDKATAHLRPPSPPE